MSIQQKEKKLNNRTRKIYENMSDWGLTKSEQTFMSYFVWLYTKKGQDHIIATQKAFKEMTFFSDYSTYGFQKLLYRLRDKHFINIEECKQYGQIKKYSITKGTILKIKALTEKEKEQFSLTSKQEQELKNIVDIAKTKWVVG